MLEYVPLRVLLAELVVVVRVHVDVAILVQVVVWLVFGSVVRSEIINIVRDHKLRPHCGGEWAKEMLEFGK